MARATSAGIKRRRTAAPRAPISVTPPKRIRSPKTAELVAERIRGQIVRGELQEGDSLPPEGKLIESFGVSRPTLREAYRILEAENLISVTRGSRAGAAVHRPRVEVAARYAGYVLQAQATTIADLYEARQAIEPFIVSLLARGANKRGLARLKRHLAQLTAHLDAGRLQDFILGVTEFHALLVEISNNKTLTFLNRLLLNLTSRHQMTHRLRHPRPEEKSLRGALKSYYKVVSLIELGEEEAAVAHWRLHLKNAHAAWTAGGEGEQIVDSLGAA